MNPLNIPIANLDEEDEIEGALPVDFSQFSPKKKSGFVDAVQQFSKEATKGLLGTYGDILNITGLQPKETIPSEQIRYQKEAQVLEKMRKGEQPSVAELLELGNDEEIPQYSGLPSSGDIELLLEQMGASPQAESAWGRYFGRFGRFLSGAAAFGQLSPITSFVASSIGQTLEEMGASPELQTAGEIGTFLLAGKLRQPNVDKHVSNLYEAAREKIPQGTMINTGSLVNNLDNLETSFMKGLPDTSATKPTVLKSIRELKNKASGGAMPLEDLVESYHDINSKMNARDLFDTLNKAGRKDLARRFNQFKDVISETVEDYGQFNPDFVNTWKAANEGYAAIQESKKTGRFIRNILKKPATHISSHAALIAADMFLGHLPTAIIGTGSISGGLVGVKGTELAIRITNSPTLRKYYLQVIQNALKESVPGTISSLNKLGDELEKEELMSLSKRIETMSDSD